MMFGFTSSLIGCNRLHFQSFAVVQFYFRLAKAISAVGPNENILYGRTNSVLTEKHFAILLQN